MKRFIFGLTICIAVSLIGLALSGCGRQREKRDEVIPVSATKVERGNIKEILFYVGDIKAQDEVELYPRVQGKLVENTLREGDRVKRDDIVAFVDRDEIGFEFEKSPVTSPIEGIVGKVYLDRGVSVSPSTAIAKIVDMDIVRVRVDAVERDLPKLKDGQTAQILVDAYKEAVFQGVVDRISPVVDLASRTAMVEIEIPNQDHRLKPGMFARVKILIKEKEDVLIIPRDAIIKKDNLNYLFLVGADNKVYLQKIEIGLHEENRFEVTEGLNGGELVVTMGNIRLKEGDLVEVVNIYTQEEIEE